MSRFSLSLLRKLFLYSIILSSLLYNTIFRLFLQIAYLSSSAALIAGILAYTCLLSPAKRLLDLRNPDIKAVRVEMGLVHHVNLVLVIGVVSCLFISFTCYLVVAGLVRSEKQEYIGCCCWYLMALLCSFLLLLETWREKVLVLAPSFLSRLAAEKGWEVSLWQRKVVYVCKLSLVSLGYLLFVFTMFDSCFRANGFVQYYAKADMQPVLDTYLHFDCYCQGGLSRPFQACLSTQRSLDNSSSSDRVFILEHGMASNSFLERSLVRYLAQNMKSWTVCAYNRQMHGWSDRLPYSILSSKFPDVSTNVRYLASWIQSQNLNQGIVYAGHAYGGLHVAQLALAYPKLVRNMIYLDSSPLENKIESQALAGSNLVFPPSTGPMLNGLGLFTGFPIIILSSLSSDSLYNLVSPYVETKYGVQDGLYCSDPADYREMMSAMLALSWVEFGQKDDIIGFANSQHLVLSQLNARVLSGVLDATTNSTNTATSSNGALQQPALWISRQDQQPVQKFDSRFFRNISVVVVNDTTSMGIISRQWKETGDHIVGWMKNATVAFEIK